MKHSHTQLESKAQAINNTKFWFAEMHVNRRNGAYAIDYYSRTDGKYLGYLQVGLTAAECYYFLRGFQEACLAF